ncbi:rhomboid family intramembrane serine protease [Verrucomicrobiaceae bacterium N1E253]|uniref:Rhomboid family intramembrane serine protease n=1 Tax=Oceaniferula marina TaxID=2748318 RepID=A0A851GMW7_9BACT|nr:rhomboid family intramembrane serine protease [Oceaniferula marina]NWK57181.1 rhomboid family intramembrane serine protease [Oceaniferula marina]
MTLLTVSLIAVYALLAVGGGVERWPEPFVWFGLSWDGLSKGRVWQLLSYGVLHGNWLHLWVNVLMLWMVGGRVMHILGWRKCMEIIFYGVLFGGVLHALTGLVFAWTGHDELYLVGISGACFALLLALVSLSPEVRMWPVPVSGKHLGMGLILAELGMWLMHPGLGLPGLSQMGGLVAGWAGGGLFEISHACHFGGSVAGWWCVRRLLTSPPTLQQLQDERAQREGPPPRG